MPSHLYTTRNEPARWWDVILAHAIELAVACYSAFMGVVVIMRASSYAPTAGSVLGYLPDFLIYAIGIFVAGGAFTALWGLLVRRSNIRAELNVEQIGWFVLSAGWLAYLYASIRYADGPSAAVAAGIFIGLGGILRGVALIFLERQLEQVVKAVALEGGETETDTTEEGNPDAGQR